MASQLFKEDAASMNARTPGCLLAAWSFGFACTHMAWAVGWRGGVPADAPPISERPVFLAYDVIAGLLMYVAAGVAVVLSTYRAPRWLRVTTAAAAGLALLRGVPALVFDIATRDFTAVGFFADIWFVTAGAGGLLLLRIVTTKEGDLATR